MSILHFISQPQLLSANTPLIRLVFVFIMPIGLENIGWKMYMVNASWDIIILGLIVSDHSHSFRKPRSCWYGYMLIRSYTQVVYWVETKGKTLEEIDAIFEGQKHSAVPDVEEVRQGEKTISLEAVEKATSS